MKRDINLLKILMVINPIIVIISIYTIDLNRYFIKPLLACTVSILCALEFHLLDKLHKNKSKDLIK